VTLRLPEGTSPEQVLLVQPAPTSNNEVVLEWQYEEKMPEQPVAVLFLQPALWKALEAMQMGASAPDAPATAHYNLGQRYRELARLPVPAGAPVNLLFDRFYPMAVAEMELAVRQDPSLTQIHMALAQLYRARAVMEDGSLDPNYVALSAIEMEKAYTANAQDPELVQLLAETYLLLTDEALARGDQEVADNYLDRLEALLKDLNGDQTAVNALAERLTEERRLAMLAQAERLLDRQRNSIAAWNAAVAAVGVDTLLPSQGQAPRFGPAHIQVDTSWGMRIVTATLPLRPTQRLSGRALLLRLVEAWNELGAADVAIAEGEAVQQISIRIPFADATDLIARQIALADVIDRAGGSPDLSLLTALLRPETLIWEGAERRFTDVSRFQERVNLRPAAERWQTEAQALRRLADSLPVTANGTEGMLSRLQQAFWTDDAAAWDELGTSEVRYRLTLRPRFGPTRVRTWVGHPGEVLEMEGEVVSYRLQAWGAAGVLTALALSLMAWQVWRRL